MDTKKAIGAWHHKWTNWQIVLRRRTVERVWNENRGSRGHTNGVRFFGFLSYFN
ncbi:hypothetical protein [Heyndrickxia camelliae]|uniref:hypothetical protein n=1 Tax=Heyndrickxia camelliae TaxID=1707093 RepID=UPI0013FDF9B0|nr:hypothetical protein [Heyndrickxia camelliae]